MSLVLAAMLAIPRTGYSQPASYVQIRELTGDSGGRTTDEIMKVMKARGGLFRACYQRELNRQPGLRGQLVVTSKVGLDGKTTTVRIDRFDRSPRRARACIQRQFMSLKFRATGKTASLETRILFTTE